MRLRVTVGLVAAAAAVWVAARVGGGGHARAGALVESLAESPGMWLELAGDPDRAACLCARRGPQAADLIALGPAGARAAAAEFRRRPAAGGPERDLTLACLARVIEAVQYAPARPALEQFLRQTEGRADLPEARAAARRLVRHLPLAG